MLVDRGLIGRNLNTGAIARDCMVVQVDQNTRKGVLKKHFQGFNLIFRESVGMMCAEVKIPAYTRGHAQLDGKVETRAITHL